MQGFRRTRERVESLPRPMWIAILKRHVRWVAYAYFKAEGILLSG
jgi:hypothetical protein